MDAEEWKAGDTCFGAANKKKRQIGERDRELYQCLPVPDVPVKGGSVRFTWIGGIMIL